MLQNSENITSKNRWHYIDLMKCIGMLFVIAYHSSTYSCSWMDTGEALSFLRYFFSTILSTCVPLFFFANGYLLLNKPFALKKHITKIVKIIFLTVLWGIIVIALLMPIENEYLSLGEFISYLWTWHQGWINYLWYMGALVCIYVFFPLLKTTFDADKRAFVCFTVICAILTFGNTFISDSASITLNIFKLYEGTGRVNFFSKFNPFRDICGYSFVYFCVGGLAHDAKERIEKISARKRISAATLVIVLSCFGLFVTGIFLSKFSGTTWDVVWNGYDTVFTFTNVIMLFVLSLSYKGECKLIRSIAENTLGIYFMHEVFIHLTRKYVINFPVFSTFIGCVIYAFAIMLLCLFVTKIMLKTPLIKWAVKL